MPADITDVLNVFSKFLDAQLVKDLKFSRKGKVKKLQSLDDILALPIYAYKFLEESEAKILEQVLDVFDIGEAAKLDKDDPFAGLLDLESTESTEDPLKTTEMMEQLKSQVNVLKEKFPNLEKNLRKTITISKLIADIKDETIELDKKQQKILVIGLDNAGKTAILSKFGGKLGINDLANLKPTKGVERQSIKTEELDLLIWDMGGQAEYRNKYMDFPEQFFLEVDLVLFVVDCQDNLRFEDAFLYFRKILEILHTLEESPYVLVFIHKVDPDLKDDPKIKLNIELIKEVTADMFLARNYDFEYEIYLTSIYSMISSEPKFSKYMKDIMKAGTSVTDPTINKIDGLGTILEETMNAIIRLSESLSIQLNDIDDRLRLIESGAVQLPQSAPAPGLTPPGQVAEVKSGQNVRSRVLDELKDLFAKKKNLNL